MIIVALMTVVNVIVAETTVVAIVEEEEAAVTAVVTAEVEGTVAAAIAAAAAMIRTKDESLEITIFLKLLETHEFAFIEDNQTNYYLLFISQSRSPTEQIIH